MSDIYPQADSDLVRRVWQVMQQHKGYDRRIDRDSLTLAATKSLTKNNDRKARDALAELPVIWQDGYFIPKNQREAAPYRAAMQSRQAAIGQRLRELDDYLRSLGAEVEQLSLLEDRR